MHILYIVYDKLLYIYVLSFININRRMVQRLTGTKKTLPAKICLITFNAMAYFLRRGLKESILSVHQ